MCWRRSDESAAVEDPDANEAVGAACTREAHVVEELDVFREWVRAGQRDDVEFAAPLTASRSPREYQSMTTVKNLSGGEFIMERGNGRTLC